MVSMVLDMPMAKKGRGRGPHASELRRGHPSSADLRKVAEELMAAAGELQHKADQMDSAGLKRVSIDGAKKAENGMKQIWGYVGAVHKGLIDFQYGG